MNHSGIMDNGVHFQIVPSTRKITVPPAYRVIGTVGEHFAEQLTFKVPKLIDGHDIANCARKYVTWKNINGDIGHDELKNMTEDGEDLCFTWDVSNGLTVASGLVSFSVHFEDVDANGVMLYRWSTTTCNECEILDTINAILNVYEAVYVAGDTLVFADYNVVEDGVLPLDTDGLVPEGTLEITQNGFHEVGKYAAVNVGVNAPSGTISITQNGKYDVTDYAEAQVTLVSDTPQITVSGDGKVKATANGVESSVQLNSDIDSEFTAQNIRKGANIFGVEGTMYCTDKIVTLEVQYSGGTSSGDIVVDFIGVDDTEIKPLKQHIQSGGTATIQVLQGSTMRLENGSGTGYPILNTEASSDCIAYHPDGGRYLLVVKDGTLVFFNL